MSILKTYNDTSKPHRLIVLDIETTGLFTADGHRLVEVGALEMVNGQTTGLEFYALVNPERAIPDEVSKIHGITDAKVAGQPVFAAVADQLRQFIGDDTVVITCRTKDGYTLDIAFLNMEFSKAGVDIVPESQWQNVRRWSEEMFGNDNATLDRVLDHYGISRAERDEKGHGAILDARLLSDVYPSLLKDYIKFLADGVKPEFTPQPKPPSL